MEVIDLSRREFDADSPVECVVHLAWYCLPTDVMTEILSRPFQDLVLDQDIVDAIDFHLTPSEPELMDDIGASNSTQSAHALLFHISKLLKSTGLPEGSTIIHGPVEGIQHSCYHAIHDGTVYVIFRE
jgi:hypothetical protein